MRHNAIIRSTMLGIEDHGILSFFLNLDIEDGSGQGFGGWALDNPYKEDGQFIRRVGGSFGADLILQILKTLEVDTWEKLPGIPCRIEHTVSSVDSIGHFIKDKWLTPKALYEEHKSGKFCNE